MSTPLHQIAQLVDGRLQGDGAIPICGADIVRDVEEGEITLVDDASRMAALRESPAAAVVVPPELEPEIPFVVVQDVHAAFARIITHFRPPRVSRTVGVSPAAEVSPSARIGRGVTVYAGATIDEDVEIGDGSTIHPGVHVLAGCRIGERVTIFPNAVLYENTVVGDGGIIHAGAVLGAYGFGYETVDGRHQLSAQLGYVELEADVEVGANTTIDRGTYGATRIGEGTKIDNLVMIAHNCRIGRRNRICSQVGIAGSCTTGDDVVMAGQVGLRDHVSIGDRAVLAAKAGIMNNIPANSVYLGIPATPERQQLVKQAALSKLPELRKEFKMLVKRVDEMDRRSRREAA